MSMETLSKINQMLTVIENSENMEEVNSVATQIIKVIDEEEEKKA